MRLVVPFPAGSATDQVARLTGLRLQEALGQTFVIDNRPGAQGIIRPEVKDRFAVIGTDVAPMNPEQFGGFIKSEVAKWAKLVKEAGIQPE